MRPLPSPILAWSTPGARPFRKISDAYYRIARQLVVAKYPPFLITDTVIDEGVVAGWSAEKIAVRSQKVIALFFSDVWSEQPRFNERRWRQFIRRLASYLRFVDQRRGLAAELATLSVDKVHEEFERAERQATWWMTRAAAIRDLMPKGPL